MKIDEVAENVKTGLAETLHSAVETISSSQKITFRLYVKQVLPLDGYVYWLNAEIVNPDEIERLGLSDSPFTVTIPGSLHRQIINEQTETISQSVNHIIFTPLEKIDDFNVVDPNGMYLGEYDGVQFTFSRMESKYTQAGIFHYRGDSVRPSMRSQIIDKADDINTDLILSNSMPIWLTLNHIAPVYPSFLSPANSPTPYIVADVRATESLQSAPLIYRDESMPDVYRRSQHVQDSVRITLYGLNNDDVLSYIDHIVERAVNYEEFGITNSPIPVDDKLNQVEINTLAKKKHVDFEINYYQKITRDLAMKLISNALINLENE